MGDHEADSLANMGGGMSGMEMGNMGNMNMAGMNMGMGGINSIH